MALQELKKLLKEKGVVGAGGAGFPTYGKLSEDVESIILNGAECEPLFHVDKNILKEKSFEVLKALDILVRELDAKEGIIGIKEHYEEANEAIDKIIYKFPKLRKKLLKDGYPAGDEVVLVYETTGKIVPQGGIPINVGAMVINVETVLNIYNAIENNESVTYKYLTVGGAVKNPKTLRVPLGSKFEELIKIVGGSTIKDFKLLVGGPMTGKIGSLNECVSKTTKGIFILPKDSPVIEMKEYNLKFAVKRAMGVCSQCRMCTDLCPRNLLGHSIEPHKIMNSLAFGLSYDSEVFVNALACCECNLCSAYSCHQNLNPRGVIADLKGRLRASGVKPTIKEGKVKSEREFRRLPVNRLVSRLKLTKYNIDAPLDLNEYEFNRLVINTRQSIGGAVNPIIKKGDRVNKNEILGTIEEESLGVFLHSPIKGEVEYVDSSSIVIRKVE